MKKKRGTAHASLRRKRTRVAARVPDLEYLLRGSLIERYKKCGKLGCHCAKGEGHGPATYLSVTLAPGKTRSYYVPARLRKRIAQYVANYRKLRELAEEVTRINRDLLETGGFDEE